NMKPTGIAEIRINSVLLRQPVNRTSCPASLYNQTPASSQLPTSNFQLPTPPHARPQQPQPDLLGRHPGGRAQGGAGVGWGSAPPGGSGGGGGAEPCRPESQLPGAVRRRVRGAAAPRQPD